MLLLIFYLELVRVVMFDSDASFLEVIVEVLASPAGLMCEVLTVEDICISFYGWCMFLEADPVELLATPKLSSRPLRLLAWRIAACCFDESQVTRSPIEPPPSVLPVTKL